MLRYTWNFAVIQRKTRQLGDKPDKGGRGGRLGARSERDSCRLCTKRSAPATGALSVVGPPNKDPESLATQDTFKTKHVAKQDHKGNVAQWVSFMEA